MNTVFDMLVGIFKELQYQRTIDKTTNIQGYKMMHHKVIKILSNNKLRYYKIKIILTTKVNNRTTKLK